LFANKKSKIIKSKNGNA